MKNLKKGSKVIFNNENYTVWEKTGNAVKIYKPDSEMPELTMIATSIKNVRRADK